MEKDKKTFSEWVKEHKKPILIGSAITTAVVIPILFAVSKKNTNPVMYSSEWIRGLSDSDWIKQREIVRLKMCSSKNKAEAVELRNLLGVFDHINYEKQPVSRETIYPPHREHGWNLYKPD